jgi:hypothetical protein
MENNSFKKESFQRVENSSDKKSQLIVNNCICKTQNLEKAKRILIGIIPQFFFGRNL